MCVREHTHTKYAAVVDYTYAYLLCNDINNRPVNPWRIGRADFRRDINVTDEFRTSEYHGWVLSLTNLVEDRHLTSRIVRSTVVELSFAVETIARRRERTDERRRRKKNYHRQWPTTARRFGRDWYWTIITAAARANDNSVKSRPSRRPITQRGRTQGTKTGRDTHEIERPV